MRTLLCTLALAVTVTLAGGTPALSDPGPTVSPAGGITCCRK